MRELTIKTERRTQLIDITSQVREARRRARRARPCWSTCRTRPPALTINEHADPLVARDFEMALERLVPRRVGLAAHRGGRGERALAPAGVADGAAGLVPLATASWRSAPGRAIFFCEFDGPRTRSVYVSVLQ